MIWKAKDKKIEYGKNTIIMGILNITPDSFSDGGKYNTVENAVKRAKTLENQGADIIDIGAQSTRPNYKEISAKEEWERLEEILVKTRENTKLPISVDTYFPFVAEKALKNGADIINDISGVISNEMAQIVKNEGAGWIIMHNGGEKDNIIEEVRSFFTKSVKMTKNLGIDQNSICFDMGIGFGKTYEENLQLIKYIKEYKLKNYPLLLGTSRKRVIGTGSKEENPEKRTFGNISADTVAIFGGADIIRLHDVDKEKHGIYMACELKNIKRGE